MKKIRIIVASVLMALCVFLFAQDNNSAQNSQSYHGMRVSTDQSDFEVVYASSESGILQLGFSIPVNPQSFKAENISLNGSPLANSTPIKFNKTGKIVEITMDLPAESESVLSLSGILSYDNQPLANTELAGLKANETVHYSFK